MYNTSKDRAPTKPVTISRAQADHDFSLWLRENNIKTVTDATGFNWRIEVAIQVMPDAVNRSGEHWQAQVIVAAEATSADLMRGGIFNKEQKDDARLLGLLGDRSVALKTEGATIVASSIANAKTQLAASLISLRQSMAKEDFRELKRQAVMTTIDHAGRFSLRP